MMRVREVHFCFHFYDCKLHAHLKPFQKLHTESRLGPIDESLSQNQKSGPIIMTKSLGVAEDFGPERGQPPGFHASPIRACERFHLRELNYRF